MVKDLAFLWMYQPLTLASWFYQLTWQTARLEVSTSRVKHDRGICDSYMILDVQNILLPFKCFQNFVRMKFFINTLKFWANIWLYCLSWYFWKIQMPYELPYPNWFNKFSTSIGYFDVIVSMYDWISSSRYIFQCPQMRGANLVHYQGRLKNVDKKWIEILLNYCQLEKY